MATAVLVRKIFLRFWGGGCRAGKFWLGGRCAAAKSAAIAVDWWEEGVLGKVFCDLKGFSNRFCGFSTGFPQGVEKVWGTDGKNAKKMLRPLEMLKKHGGNEWKSERNGVVENSVENVENFSERAEKLSFPQVLREQFSDV
jgi:hypothetical protein